MAVLGAQLGVDMAALMTASGARIATLSPDIASAFLDRYGLADHVAGSGDLAWGAFEDSGPLIGVGILSQIIAPRGRANVAVVPERRRLGVGSELVASVAAAAKERGVRYLTCRHRAADAAPHYLARSLGLPIGRRVDGGMVWTVIVLPGGKERQTS